MLSAFRLRYEVRPHCIRRRASAKLRPMQTPIEQDAVAILETINADYETDCYSSSSPDELAGRLEIDQLRIYRAIDLLLAHYWIEKTHETLAGYEVCLTTSGKERFDSQTHNAENERIRAAILHELAVHHERTPGQFTDSDSLASTLKLNWNPVYFNLRILESNGFVRMSPYCGTGHPSAQVQITSNGKAFHDVPPKKVVFISHAAADRDIAVKLRTEVERSFPAATVFVSSAPDVLELGDPWIEKILDALAESVVAIILCSRTSLSRPWVWFEAGAAWGRKIPMLCVCVGAQRKSALPAPFNAYQAADLDETTGVEAIFAKLEKIFGLSVQPLDSQRIVAEIAKSVEVGG